MRVEYVVSRVVYALIASLPWLTVAGQTLSDARRDAASLEAEARKHLEEQKPELAIPVLKRLVALDPKNVTAQAEGEYQAALRVNRHDELAWRELGGINSALIAAAVAAWEASLPGGASRMRHIFGRQASP